MLNSSLLNQRMYNDSPQYLLLLDKSDTISIAEIIHRILKCYVNLADNISISDIEDELVPILYILIANNVSILEDLDFRMYVVKWIFKNVMAELDHVEITDELKFKGVT